MVICPQYGEMGHGGTPPDTHVQHDLHYPGVGHPYFEPERWGGLVIQWQTIASETQVGQQRAPVELGRKVGVHAHSVPHIHKLGGLFVHLWLLSATKVALLTRIVIRYMVSVLAFETVNPNKQTTHCNDICHPPSRGCPSI